ncbi:MAG: sugar phosphate isomerase/epimerase family protein [Chitinispirillaceae bacterium]
MKAGFKLDADYWSSDQYSELFGDLDILETLWEKGIRALEVPVGSRTDRMLLSEHIRRCTDAGFSVSIHPYTEATEYNPSCFEDSQQNPCRHFHEELFFLALEASVHQKGVSVVNIHPAADLKTLSRMALVEQSVRFFAWAVGWCAQYAPTVLVTAELQIAAAPRNAVVRVGDSFSELEQIAARSDCGLCWDFGHAYLNHLRYGMPQDPDPELLKKIVHVHCHDVQKRDHWPMLANTSGWEEKLRMLIRAGFNETVVLEITPRNYLQAGGFQAFERSVETLFRSAAQSGGVFER